MLPLNIVMPATKRDAARVFLGAAVVATRRMPEWMSCRRCVSVNCTIEEEVEGYLRGGRGER